MKNLKKLLYFIPLTALILLASCKDNWEDPFKGGDNYITNFSLIQKDQTFTAAIVGEDIIVTVPSGHTLDGAVVLLETSENASVNPDPTTITNWDVEKLFTVTSLNGERRVYQYSIEYSSTSHKGSLTLNTQTEVDEFGALGHNAVHGNLMVAIVSSAEDPITSLEPLSALKEIGYYFTIGKYYEGTNLSGLENLEKVGADFIIEEKYNTSMATLKEVNLPNLKKVGFKFAVSGNKIAIYDTPKLERVGKAMQVIAGVLTQGELSLPSLQSVGERLYFGTTSQEVHTISIPSLKSVGNDVMFNAFTKVSKLDLSQLKTCGGLSLSSMSLNSLLCNELEEINGTLTTNGTKLKVLSFPELRTVKDINIGKEDIQLLDFPKLEIIKGNFTLPLLPIEDLRSFKSLTAIEGTFTLSDYTFESLVLPVQLKVIKGLSLQKMSGLKNLDLRGIEVENLSLGAHTLLDLTITGDKVFKGIININDGSVTDTKMPVLNNIEEIGGLVFQSTRSFTEVKVIGVKKINGDLSMIRGMSNFTNLTSIDFPDLEEITGRFIANSLLPVTKFSFPKLKKVGNGMTISYFSTSVSSLSFPELVLVAGAVSFNTGGGATQFFEISVPKLTTIEGDLTLTGGSNTGLQNLNGFSRLQTVASIKITGHTALTDYSGLKIALPKIGSDKWVATGNAYNPSYEDLVNNNKWIQE